MVPSAAVLPTPTPAVANVAEMTAVMVNLGKLMPELCEIIDSETELVRAGRVAAAAKAGERKAELARAFVHDIARVRAGGSHLASVAAPLRDSLRQQHELLCARLQVNLTVLATARGVSEGILRGVSSELAKRSTVRTYGAGGRYSTPAMHRATPIAVSRSL